MGPATVSDRRGAGVRAQMMMLAIQSVRGRPVSERIQMAFVQSGFLLLVGLTLVLIVRDTSQLPVVQQLMGR